MTSKIALRCVTCQKLIEQDGGGTFIAFACGHGHHMRCLTEKKQSVPDSCLQCALTALIAEKPAAAAAPAAATPSYGETYSSILGPPSGVRLPHTTDPIGSVRMVRSRS